MYGYAYHGFPAGAYGYPPGPGAVAGYDAATGSLALAGSSSSKEKKSSQKDTAVGFGYGASRDKKRDASPKEKKSKKNASKKEERSSKKAKTGKRASSPDRSSWPEGLAVSGCKDKTVKKIVRGNFTLAGENHGRPYYKRDEQFEDLNVLIYYWDDRDGDDFAGWWFGPKVGGDQVWAYQPAEDLTPPLTGWKVPYDGPVDKHLALKPQETTHPRARAAASGAPYWYGMPGTESQSDPHMSERQYQEMMRMHEDARRRMEEANLRLYEEERRRQDEARKREEQLQKKRQEEAKRMQEANERRAREGRALFNIRKVLTKVQMAGPETIEALEKELAEILSQELEATGSQRAVAKMESDSALEQAKNRIEILNEAKRKAQEKKEEDDKKRQELEARAKALLAELDTLLGPAEIALQKLKDVVGNPEETKDNPDQVQLLDARAENVESAGKESKALAKTCMDFLVANGPEMKDPGSVIIPGQPAQPSEIKQTMTKLLARINECTKSTDSLIASFHGARDAGVRRAVAERQTKEAKALFARYDQDGDGTLSKTEVAAFANGELQMSPSDQLMTKIWRCAVDDGQNGVNFERFHLMRVKLGSSKELHRDGLRKLAREAKEKVLAAVTSKLEVKVQAMEHSIDGVEKAVSKTENTVPPLSRKERAQVSRLEIMQRLEDAQAMVEAAKEVASSVLERISVIGQGVDVEAKYEDDAKKLSAQIKRPLEKRVKRFELRLQRAQNLCARFRCEDAHREKVELHASRCFAAKVARQHLNLKGISSEDLFHSIDRNGDGGIDLQEFQSFFASVDKEIKGEVFWFPAASDEHQWASSGIPELINEIEEDFKCDLTPELLAQIFRYIAGSDTKISKEMFCMFMRAYYKVVKETSMTEDLIVNGSPIVRQVKPDEVFELVEGPEREELMKVMRVKAKPSSEEMEEGQGWLTIKDSKGAPFLQEWSGLFRVVCDVQLRDAQEPPEEGSSKEMRILKQWQLLEAIQWPKKHEELGITLMKVRVLADGAVGWITQTSNDGVIYAKLY